MTLAEVMVASVIIVMITVGALACLSKSYEIAAHARLKDNARAVLRTYGDQFLRLQTTERSNSGITYNRWLFNVTNGPTSQGLRWGSLSNDSTATAMPTTPLVVPLRGNGDAATSATITRDVVNVNPNTGAANGTTRVNEAAGYYLQATFTATYVFQGQQQSESLTFVRAVP